MMSFQHRVAELRKKNNLSQSELGEILNVARNTISMWETGNRLPDYETLILIAQYFNVSTDYLLGLSPQKETDAHIELDNEEIQYWIKELMEAPVESREEIKKIWGIIRERHKT